MKHRRTTHSVSVGGVMIGSAHDIVVQSMTNSDTADIAATTKQIAELYHAGSAIVRITVNNEQSAAAVPKITDQLAKLNVVVPIIGDFHYNGHHLLRQYPDCAAALAKYRINPGNVGFGNKKDSQFAEIIEIAVRYNKPVRIGVNWGSLDEKITMRLMDENATAAKPLAANELLRKALVTSALDSSAFAEKLGMASDKIIISCKVSKVADLVAIYREIATRCNYPLHLGLTEAGGGEKGLIATTAALSILLNEGIGDTIRASLTPRIGESREKEVAVCLQILQSLELGFFVPQVTACPGCGRTTSQYFQHLAAKIEEHLASQMTKWKAIYPEAAKLNVAVMGCIVNGPGESKHADIGISLPGNGESPIAVVFADGVKFATLRGDNIADEFIAMVDEFVAKRYGS